MTRGRLVVHAHFYQPLRVDPFSGTVPADPRLRPSTNWNARVAAECYRPNAERRNLGQMSWDLGPTLAEWLETGDPKAYRGFIDGDRPADRDASIPVSRGNGMAQSYHHAIRPLASAADRRTEIRWGMRDFLLRFGRDADGLWFPETAVDIASLRIAAEEGIRYTILAPWQAATPSLDTRRPYRVELGGGRSIVVVFYDAGAVLGGLLRATRPRPTPTASRASAIAPRAGRVVRASGGLAARRDRHRRRAVRPSPGVPRAVPPAPRPARRRPAGPRLRRRRPGVGARARRCERRSARSASTSGRRGAAITASCAGAANAAASRTATGRRRCAWRSNGSRRGSTRSPVAQFGALPGAADPWAARDAYIDVVLGAEPSGSFAAHWLGSQAPVEARRTLLGSSRHSAGGSRCSRATAGSGTIRCAWRRARSCASRRARRGWSDEIAGTDLERRLLEDLTLLRSPRSGLDGAAIYQLALQDVGQSSPAASDSGEQASA